MKSLIKTIANVFLVMLVIFLANTINVEAKTKKYVKICDYYTDKAIHYVTSEGNCDDTSEIYLKTNYKIKKILWKSSKSNVIELENHNKKKNTITYKKEGLSTITLTVKDKKNKKHKYKILASSYTPVAKETRLVKKGTIIRYAPTTKKCGVSSKIKKIKKHTLVKIYGKCGKYYYVKVGKIKGFVDKKHIIPFTTISATPINGKIKLNVANHNKNTVIYKTTNENENNLNKCTKININKSEYIDSNVTPGTRYYYKCKYNNKVYTAATAYTNIINGNENIKYFSSLGYSNLYIQGRDDKAFNDDETKYIRFYLINNGTTLEAHINIKYYLGNDLYSPSDPNSYNALINGGFYYDLKGNNDTYMDVFEQAINHSYNSFIPGSNNDFDNHSFNFAIKTHIYDYNDYHPDDNVESCLPDEIPDGTTISTPEKKEPLAFSIKLGNSNCWYKDGNVEYTWSFADYNTRELYVANSAMLELNKYIDGDGIPGQYSVTKEQYRNTCAHELGHILGLDDAYVDSNGADRMSENEETCRIVYNEGTKTYENLMKDCYGKITPNDVEMILYANQSGNNLFVQSYKTTNSNTISNLIKNRNDYVKN